VKERTAFSEALATVGTPSFHVAVTLVAESTTTVASLAFKMTFAV
jgi:hypothetical protein